MPKRTPLPNRGSNILVHLRRAGEIPLHALEGQAKAIRIKSTNRHRTHGRHGLTMCVCKKMLLKSTFCVRGFPVLLHCRGATCQRLIANHVNTTSPMHRWVGEAVIKHGLLSRS
ncbi:unnamed protein product [Ectocarpus sp. 4 AP-2014]